MPADTLKLSRRYYTSTDRTRRWLTVFGGKLTGSDDLGRRVVKELAPFQAPSGEPFDFVRSRVARRESFPGLEESVPAADWCARRESCWTLEDYLRRRTNIAQWVPRGGLGKSDGNRSHLESLALRFCAGPRQAAEMVGRYSERIERAFDQVLDPLRKGSQK